MAYDTILCPSCDTVSHLPDEIKKMKYNMITTHTCPNCSSILDIWVKAIKTYEVMSFKRFEKREETENESNSEV